MGIRTGCACVLIAVLMAGCASTGDNGRRVNTAEQQCLALAMYWEARGEGARGMVAVGSVVLNRMEDRAFPNSACAVVTQGGETPPCQFGWWCDGRRDVPRERPQWVAALAAAEHIFRARPGDPTRGALFFHRAAIKTPWLSRRQRTTRIGGHVFYR